MFNIGDLVQLKSGSPLMTVSSVQGNTIHCTWFDNHTQRYGEFLAATLVAHNEDDY